MIVFQSFSIGRFEACVDSIMVTNSEYWIDEEKIETMIEGWRILSANVTGKPIVPQPILRAVAIVVWLWRRSDPRWRRGRWKAKT